MRHSAGEGPDGLHFLSPLQPLLQLLPLPFGFLALGDVPHKPAEADNPAGPVEDRRGREVDGDRPAGAHDDLEVLDTRRLGGLINPPEDLQHLFGGFRRGVFPVVDAGDLIRRQTRDAAKRRVEEDQTPAQVQLEVALRDAFEDGSVFLLAAPQGLLRLVALRDIFHRPDHAQTRAIGMTDEGAPVRDADIRAILAPQAVFRLIRRIGDDGLLQKSNSPPAIVRVDHLFPAPDVRTGKFLR